LLAVEQDGKVPTKPASPGKMARPVRWEMLADYVGDGPSGMGPSSKLSKRRRAAHSEVSRHIDL
jgi:hypothetical protein